MRKIEAVTAWGYLTGWMPRHLTAFTSYSKRTHRESVRVRIIRETDYRYLLKVARKGVKG